MRTLVLASALWALGMSGGQAIPAYAGGKVIGNGGNESALELEAAARAALLQVSRFPKDFPEVKVDELTIRLNRTQILVSTEPLYVEADGRQQESTAINHPEPDTIVVNDARWKAIQTDPIRQALALHELLGLAGIERTGEYPVSRRFLSKVGIQCENGLCDSSPRYRCVLIRNPLTMPEYLAVQPLGGNGTSDVLHLRSGQIHAQIFISVGSMGSTLMINLYDGDTMVNTIELPRSPFPRTLNLFWRKSAQEAWAVNCSQ